VAEPILLDIRDLRIEGRAVDEWHPIVNGVDLRLRRGEVLGLIGESGAGKSTLGLAAMGFVRDGCRISGGSVAFDGVDLVTAPEAVRRALRGRRIAYVAQSAAASFNPAHRLMDQTCEAPVVHGVLPRARAEEEAVALFRRMRLPDPEEIGFRYPHQVSGGQLQRAMTAMAMACRPDLIIFDEPTTALDVTTQVEVLAAIRDAVSQFGTAGHLHHPRPRRGVADGGPHQGAPARGRGGGGGHPHHAEPAARGLHALALGGAELCAARAAAGRGQARPVGEERDGRLPGAHGAPRRVLRHPCGPHGGGGGRVGERQVHLRAQRSRASCRRDGGRCFSTGGRCRRASARGAATSCGRCR
jgi:ABC-type dipeptide/oligopeptide/nickel transport system ATPase subunit